MPRSSTASMMLLAAWLLLAAGCHGGARRGGVAPARGGGVAPAPEQPIPATMRLGPVAVTDVGSELEDRWFTKGAFMEINVRAYHDSDGDGVGDLNGVTAKLDYLEDLGVAGIWLLPVTNTDDHDSGYIVTDHRSVETEYGTEADLKTLIDEAHKRHIGVILDYVMNHSAATNPLFVNAASSPTASHRDWYVWQPLHPDGWLTWTGRDPWTTSTFGAYYAVFDKSMPDFNLRNREVVEYHKSSLRYWLNLGVDGFRFDSIDTLIENGPRGCTRQPENLVLMREMRRVVNEYRNRYIVCESPGQPAGAASEKGCRSAFGFNMNRTVRDLARGTTGALSVFTSEINSAPIGNMATLLANHDRFAGLRLMDEFSSDETSYRLAAATLLTMPGIPFVYYGEEVGMQNMSLSDFDATSDWPLRGPMSWAETPTVTDNTRLGRFASFNYFKPAPNIATRNVLRASADAGSLWSFYRTLMNLRRTSTALREGDFQVVTASANSLAIERRSSTESVVVVMNYGSTRDALRLASLKPGLHYKSLVTHRAGAAPLATPSNGASITVAAPPRSIQVFQATFADQGVYEAALYVSGDMNGWAVVPAAKLLYRGANRYEVALSLDTPRTYVFEITDAARRRYGFGGLNASRSGPKNIDLSDGLMHQLESILWSRLDDHGVQIEISEPGRYVFTLDSTNALSPKLMVSKQ